MEKNQLLQWVKAEQNNLDVLMVSAAEEYYEKYKNKSYFSFDAKETGKELWNLGNNQDLCYDRPTIGLNYALWYHPKRINTFLKYFVDLIFRSKSENAVTIFDLGAGTGSVLWAVGLIVTCLRRNNVQCPNIKVVNIDTSPFMLYYNYDFLWKKFNKFYPEAADIVTRNDYKLNSWTNISELSTDNIWLCASYLFDQSDNSQIIMKDFSELIKLYKPNKVILLSSANKKTFVDAVGNQLRSENYIVRTSNNYESVFYGKCPKLAKFRDDISNRYSLQLAGSPKWNIDSLYGILLENNIPSLGLEFNNVHLYTAPQRNRSLIKLTPEQDIVAKVTGRPTIITGPAGCGKSVVITKKLINILEASKVNGSYDPQMKILVTTFNKALSKHLGDWIEQLLPVGETERKIENNIISYFTFKGSGRANIMVMHFDLLPTRISNIRKLLPYDESKKYNDFHNSEMKIAIDEYIAHKKINVSKFQKILNSEFLLEEYKRVIYGLNCNYKIYLSTERTGRGTQIILQKNSERRHICWEIINLYLRNLKSKGYDSFTIRRHKFIKSLKQNEYQFGLFDHILVDEFQDCTQSDYEIFYRLIKTPNNLTFAGDIAQAIQIGKSADIPRLNKEVMGNFNRLGLSGSFRLPFRVSECLAPFSELMAKQFGEKEGLKIDKINAYKGAPPGARPIILYGENSSEAALKIKDILDAYQRLLHIDKATIFELDYDLENKLKKIDVQNVETEFVLRAKGLEKSCVIWSTSTHIENASEINEFVYTILTRTVSLLIIVLYPDIRKEYVEILNSLVTNRIIFWDVASKEKFLALKNISGIEIEDDVDDSEEVVFLEDENRNEITI